MFIIFCPSPVHKPGYLPVNCLVDAMPSKGKCLLNFLVLMIFSYIRIAASNSASAGNLRESIITLHKGSTSEQGYGI